MPTAQQKQSEFVERAMSLADRAALAQEAKRRAGAYASAFADVVAHPANSQECIEAIRECGNAHSALHEILDRLASHAQLASEYEAKQDAVVGALVEALTWRGHFEPREGEGPYARFERIAEVFHRETGFLRPGKDCRINSPEHRQAIWDAWMEAGRARCRAALALVKEAK